jgi:hypothetical protein
MGWLVYGNCVCCDGGGFGHGGGGGRGGGGGISVELVVIPTLNDLMD